MSALAALPKTSQRHLDQVRSDLIEQLHDNLYALIVYGSAVRGGFKEKRSDINLLIILHTSTPTAHAIIAGVLDKHPQMTPIIIAKPGMEGNFRAFALKFQSIYRSYQVLFGDDPFFDFHVDYDLCRFLSEQALRELRLSCVQAYVKHHRNPKAYQQFLQIILVQLLTDLSEALRLRGKEIPHNYSERLPLFEQAYGHSMAIVSDMLQLKDQEIIINPVDIESLHSQLFGLLNHVISQVSS